MNKKLSIKRLLNLSVLSFGLFPIIPDKLKGVLVILLLVIALIYYFKERPKKLNFKIFIINSSLYIIYLFSLFYTADFSKAVKIMTETRLTAILLPLIFLLLSKNKELYTVEIFDKLKKVFAVSTFIFCLLYLLYLPFIPVAANPFFEFPSVFFFRNGLTTIPVLGIHPIYGSIYLGLALIFIFTDIVKNRKVEKFQIVFLLIFTVVLVLLSSKMVLISLMIITIIYFFNRFKKKPKQKVVLIFTTVLVTVSLLQIPTIKDRTKEFLKKETFTEYKRHNSTSIRIAILNCGFKVSKDNFLLGVGVGDANNKLIDCYRNISNDLAHEEYNSHNQFLSIQLGCGIFGLIIFCYFLYYNFHLGKLIIDKSFFYLVIFYGVNFFSENILERQNGVILFYFFICYFSNFAINNQTKIN